MGAHGYCLLLLLAATLAAPALSLYTPPSSETGSLQYILRSVAVYGGPGDNYLVSMTGEMGIGETQGVSGDILLLDTAGGAAVSIDSGGDDRVIYYGGENPVYIVFNGSGSLYVATVKSLNGIEVHKVDIDTSNGVAASLDPHGLLIAYSSGDTVHLLVVDPEKFVVKAQSSYIVPEELAPAHVLGLATMSDTVFIIISTGGQPGIGVIDTGSASMTMMSVGKGNMYIGSVSRDGEVLILYGEVGVYAVHLIGYSPAKKAFSSHIILGVHAGIEGGYAIAYNRDTDTLAVAAATSADTVLLTTYSFGEKFFYTAPLTAPKKELRIAGLRYAENGTLLLMGGASGRPVIGDTSIETADFVSPGEQHTYSVETGEEGKPDITVAQLNIRRLDGFRRGEWTGGLDPVILVVSQQLITPRFSITLYDYGLSPLGERYSDAYVVIGNGSGEKVLPVLLSNSTVVYDNATPGRYTVRVWARPKGFDEYVYLGEEQIDYHGGAASYRFIRKTPYVLSAHMENTTLKITLVNPSNDPWNCIVSVKRVGAQGTVNTTYRFTGRGRAEDLAVYEEKEPGQHTYIISTLIESGNTTVLTHVYILNATASPHHGGGGAAPQPGQTSGGTQGQGTGTAGEAAGGEGAEQAQEGGSGAFLIYIGIGVGVAVAAAALYFFVLRKR